MDGMVFDVQNFSLNDGPGIRTTIFFKGCPLRCSWCSNPESQNAQEELLYYKNLCLSCYSCVEACPQGANKIKKDKTLFLDRSACRVCGICAKICPSGARVISGKRRSAEEIAAASTKDSLFYRNSGGGVTLSGGEPLMQAEFVREIAAKLKKKGLHCILDTSGYAPWKKLHEVLPYIDLLYWDIKCIDPSKHKRLTGVSNNLIISNLKKTLRLGKKVVFRLPLIPGTNDSDSDIEQMGIFLRRLGIGHVGLLPYHNLGAGKYKALDKVYFLSSKKNYKREEIARISKRLETEYGLSVSIV
ncbi:MAG: Benzylsuccinate synthase activating enzyme [Smithella sp. PtaU1.Bin162]|nr:MAG: Benzylsuccinate synthase activating enzyme [Smithella sp. PtaU1.Bin162]